MTLEQKTLIELTDITGIQFSCPKCAAKLLYPFGGMIVRLPHECPNRHEAWLSQTHTPETPQTADAVREMIANLRKLADSPFVQANVRLQIANEAAKA